ncbi:EamA family transporter [candidate division WWE3 bacterium]|nr:EamA family transporter [candidate division WWE3 bacterium]
MVKKSLPKNILLAHLALLTATIIWAGAGPIIKLTLDYLPPFTFMVLRFVIVGAILLPYLLIALKRTPIDWADVPNIFWLGLFGQASIVLIFIGLKYTTAIDSSIINVLTPIATIAAGHYFYKERVNLVQKFGYGIATFGMLFIAIEPTLTTNGSLVPTHLRIFGNLLIVIYQLTWPAYIVLGKRMMGEKSDTTNKTFNYFHLHQMHKKYDSTLLTMLTFYVGLIVLIPFALWEIFGINTPQQIILNFPAILGLLYMAIFSSIVAYTLFEWGLTKIATSETAIYNYISPLFAIPIAMLFLGEKLSVLILCGMVVIATGVVIAEKYKS